MTETILVERDGADAARRALERCVTGGGVAVFPADTLYGLACDPINERAISRIHELKGRDGGKSSAVMYFSPLALRELVSGLGERTAAALDALLPGPVTLVLANPDGRYPLACREDSNRLGVRLIEGPLAGAMTPVFQTSANPSGKPAPAAIGELDPGIATGVDLIIDAGPVGGSPSTVVDLSELDEGGGWRILREGAISAAEVSERLGPGGAG